MKTKDTKWKEHEFMVDVELDIEKMIECFDFETEEEAARWTSLMVQRAAPWVIKISLMARKQTIHQIRERARKEHVEVMFDAYEFLEEEEEIRHG